MHLINVRTLKLKEFFGADVPHYAILSHRWENEEVTFQDLASGGGENMIGWKKIVSCCDLALHEDLEWAWIDSCCIDKTSSSELSEAINSMFQWYRDAEICYAYLSGVSGPLEEADNMNAFRFSKWFTRGWTLQELLAPDELKFFDKDWVCECGPEDELGGEEGNDSSRHQAYCLLGIFRVNMPLLYGEGPNAFFRLQLEIMRISNDESLFAWEDELVNSQSETSGGLLAPSPISFIYSNDIISLTPPWVERPPYSMTNKGLEISLQLEQDTSPPSPTPIWKAPLNCTREGYDNDTILSILLEQDSTGTDNYRRVESSWLPSYDLEPQLNNESPSKALQVIYVKQPQIYSGTRSYCYFRIDARSLLDNGWEIKDWVLLNFELGRWGSGSLGYLQLKLSNSSACVKISPRREHSTNTWLHDKVLVEVLQLTVSCEGKRGKAALDITSGWDPLPTILERLKIAWHDREAKEIISNEEGTLRSFVSGRLVEASLGEEGRSGGRELFTIKLRLK